MTTASLTPPGISRILATGGASSNRALLQLLANVFGVPVVSMGADNQQPGAGSAAWGAARKAFLYGQGDRRQAGDTGKEAEVNWNPGRTRSEHDGSVVVAILPDLAQTRKYVERIPEFLRLEASLL
jgi:xylulokinase